MTSTAGSSGVHRDKIEKGKMLDYLLEVRSEMERASVHVRLPSKTHRLVDAQLGILVEPATRPTPSGSGLTAEDGHQETKGRTGPTSSAAGTEDQALEDVAPASCSIDSTHSPTSWSAFLVVALKFSSGDEHKIPLFLASVTALDANTDSDSTYLAHLNDPAVTKVKMSGNGEQTNFITIDFAFTKNTRFYEDEDFILCSPATDERVADICCRSCGSVLLRGSCDDKKLEGFGLPSSLWSSFSDCVACEECIPFRTAKINAKQGRVYWSRLYGLVHFEDLEREHVNVNATVMENGNVSKSGATTTTTKSTTCKHCGSAVGDPIDSNQGVQLFKHKIYLERFDEGSSRPPARDEAAAQHASADSAGGGGDCGAFASRKIEKGPLQLPMDASKNLFAAYTDEACVGLIVRDALEVDANRKFRLALITNNEEKIEQEVLLNVIAKRVKVHMSNVAFGGGDADGEQQRRELKEYMAATPADQELFDHMCVWFQHLSTPEAGGGDKNPVASTSNGHRPRAAGAAPTSSIDEAVAALSDAVPRRTITVRDLNVYEKVLAYLKKTSKLLPQEPKGLTRWTFGYLPLPPPES